MKIVAISDTHGHHRALTDKIKNLVDEHGKFDVLTHSGDITYVGEPEVFRDFNNFIGDLKDQGLISHCIAIPGNHERTLVPDLFKFSLNKWKRQAERMQKQVLKTIINYTLLIDQEVTIDGVKFYGTPWTPCFGGNWSYQLYNDEQKEEVYTKVPTDTDVWLSHGPPKGVCDYASRGVFGGEETYEEAGCDVLLKHVNRIKPKLLLCGHLHHTRNHRAEKLACGTIVANVCICNDDYRPVQQPLTFEI